MGKMNAPVQVIKVLQAIPIIPNDGAGIYLSVDTFLYSDAQLPNSKHNARIITMKSLIISLVAV